MKAIEAAQKIIDYLRIEVETQPGNSASDLYEIAAIVQQAINAAQHSVQADLANESPKCTCFAYPRVESAGCLVHNPPNR